MLPKLKRFDLLLCWRTNPLFTAFVSNIIIGKSNQIEELLLSRDYPCIPAMTFPRLHMMFAWDYPIHECSFWKECRFPHLTDLVIYHEHGTIVEYFHLIIQILPTMPFLRRIQLSYITASFYQRLLNILDTCNLITLKIYVPDGMMFTAFDDGFPWDVWKLGSECIVKHLTNVPNCRSFWHTTWVKHRQILQS